MTVRSSDTANRIGGQIGGRRAHTPPMLRVWALFEVYIMTRPYCTKNTITKAAQLALGTRLRKLYEICETQQTISTSRLKWHLDKIADDMKLDAIHFRQLADEIDRHKNG